jgi:UbiD family decarboxylase
MAEQSIRALIAALDGNGRLARVRREVDPLRDMAAVGLKLHQERRQATLFENVAGWCSAAQLLADRGQWGLGLGVGEADVLGHVQRSLGRAVPAVPVPLARAPVATMRREGEALALERLPLPRAGAGDDAGQMAAIAIAVDPATGRDCIGLTRHHVVAPGRLSVIGLSPALAKIRQRWRERGEAMPLALALGADPALYLAAALGTWRAADSALAGSLAGAPMRLVGDGGIGVPVPAEAELVIAGEVLLEESAASVRLTTGFGSSVPTGAVPVLAARTMLHRADPIFHPLHVGAPGDYAATLCLAAEALVAEHIRNIEGGIDFLDIRCPPAAGGRVVVVKLRARVEGQAKTALMGALSGPANWLKLAIAVDEDVDAADLRDVFWSVASRTHAQNDVGMIAGMRAHPLDFAAPREGKGNARVGTRWFIDSTMPPLTQGKRRDDFARATPKNLDATDLAAFLPKP